MLSEAWHSAAVTHNRRMLSFTRRRFLQLTGGAFVAAQARAVEPFARRGAARLRLSLAAYSFREFFGDKAPAEKRIDVPKFVDFCADHGCDGAELTSYYFPQNVTPEYLRDIRRHAFLRGIEISGTAVGNTFTHPKGEARDKEIAQVKKWIDNASVMGAPHVRVFAGAAEKGASADDARRLAIEALEECAAYSGERGIFLGIENHGGIVAEPQGLLAIVRAVKSPWVGINLDTGNFHTPDPYASLAECAPYAVNVQIKTEVRAAGAKGNQPADLARLVGILRDASYQGWVALEYEAAEDPWTAVPKTLDELRRLVSSAPSGKSADTWMPLFDGKTLKGWKVTEFSGHGDVKVENGAIVLDAGNDLTGVTYPGELPKVNYEISLEAMKVSGDDFFCGLTVPVAQTHCSLIVGGWGGSVVGVSSLDGNDASENETTQFKQFEKNRWYRIRLRVASDRLQGWIDDEEMFNVVTTDKRINLRAGEIEESLPFGIASFRTRAALRDIKIRKLPAA